MGLGQPRQALADFTKSLTIHPLVAEVYCHSGLANQALGDSDEAAADLAKAYQLIHWWINVHSHQERRFRQKIQDRTAFVNGVLQQEARCLGRQNTRFVGPHVTAEVKGGAHLPGGRALACSRLT